MKKFSAVCFGTWWIGCYGYSTFKKGVAEKSYSGFCSKNVALKIKREGTIQSRLLKRCFQLSCPIVKYLVVILVVLAKQSFQ